MKEQFSEADKEAFRRAFRKYPIKVGDRDVQANAAYEYAGIMRFYWHRVYGPPPEKDETITYDGVEYKVVLGKNTNWQDCVYVGCVPVMDNHKEMKS